MSHGRGKEGGRQKIETTFALIFSGLKNIISNLLCQRPPLDFKSFPNP